MEDKEKLELQTKAFITELLAGVDTTGHFSEIINYVMKEVGSFTHAESVCIFETGTETAYVEKAYQWNTGNIVLEDLDLPFIQRSEIPNWLDSLHRKQVVKIMNPGDFSNFVPSELGIIKAHDIKGLLLVPAYVEDRLMAGICLVNPDFSLFSVVEDVFLYLGRQIGLLYHRERISHKYLLFMEEMRSSNLSEFIVDCNTSRFEAFRITKVLRNFIPEEGDWEWLRHFYSSIIRPEYKEDLLRRTEKEYLNTFLRTEQSNFTIDLEREVNGKNNWFRLEFSVVSLNEEGNLERFFLVVKDITQMKQEEKEHQTMIKALSSIYRASAIIDLGKRVVRPIKLSNAIRQFLPDDDITHEEMLEVFCKQMIQPDYEDSIREFLNLDTLSERFQETDILTFEYQGTQIGWGRIMLIPCNRNQDDILKNVVFAVQDITEQKKREEWMQYKMEHDELTGTLNRTAFNRVTKLLDSSRLPFGFVLIDIDRFKVINDTYGHDVGDEVLIRLVSVLNEKMHISDKIFRLGGDEFAIIMNGRTLNDANMVKEIVTSVNETILKASEGIPAFSVSAGITFSVHGYDEALYHNVDKALYQTKETTRKGCTVFEEMENHRN